MNREDFIKSNNEINYVAYASYLEQKEKQLIKYLESLLTDNETTNKFIVTSVENLLKKVRSGKYE